MNGLRVVEVSGCGPDDGWYVADGQYLLNETPFNTRAMAQLYLENYGEAAAVDRKAADRVDGYDRDDLGESHDF